MEQREFEFYKNLFHYPSLSSYISIREISIMDKLKEVIGYRLNEESTSSYSLEIPVSHPIDESFLEYNFKTKNFPLISITDYIEHNQELWDYLSQYFSEEFHYEVLNASGHVTWNCYDMYIVGRALLFAGSFSDITHSILEEIYEMEFEEYPDETDNIDKEEILNSWQELVYECQKAVATKDTRCEKLNTFVNDMISMLFNKIISKETFFENLETILNYIFGCCDGTYREVVTIKSKNIARFLLNKENIPNSYLKAIIQEAIDCISSPLEEGWCGLNSFTSLNEEKVYFTSSFFLGETNDECLSMHHLKPFFFLAMRKIDEWISLLI